MALSNYTYSNLLDQIFDPARRSNITNVMTVRNYINRAARLVVSENDLRSTKRNAILGTDLFDDIYSYPAPSDLKGDAIIDFVPQVNRDTDFRLELVSEQEFDMKKTIRDNIIALATDDLVKRIMFSGDVDDTSLVAATLDNLTSEGTWSAYSDATNVVADTDNFVVGGGSVKFDLTGAATTAGIQNTTITAIDISDYTNAGHIFVWAYINSTTNLTNFICDIGNDLTTNYYTQTITTNNEGVSFYNGWNLLRFDFASMTENGTVAPTTVDSIRIYMTKTSGKSDDGYRFDHMVLHTGEIHNIVYYTRYPWQSNASVFLENSTADTDYINAETDEFEGFVYKAKEEVFKELRRFDLSKQAREDYLIWKKDYINKNPSERVHRNRYYRRPTLYNRTF